MKKLKFASKSVKDESGVERLFEYYYLVEEVKTPEFFCENYGIFVEELRGDCVSIPNISTNLKRVETLISLLAEHKVSPIVCKDVVADWL